MAGGLVLLGRYNLRCKVISDVAKRGRACRNTPWECLNNAMHAKSNLFPFSVRSLVVAVEAVATEPLRSDTRSIA